MDNVGSGSNNNNTSTSINHTNDVTATTNTVSQSRPVWDETHHKVNISNTKLFALRKSGINEGKQLTLSERLTRLVQTSFIYMTCLHNML